MPTTPVTIGQVPERWALGENFVPASRYTDPDYLALEYERLFPNVWQMACREEELPEAGSFYEYVIGRTSVLVVRQADGSLRAMHNSCRHRGMKIIAGAGRVEEFRCRFHGFRYGIDGACTFIHCADEFADRDDADWALQPVHVGTWGGWVFVNPSADPEPLEEWLDPLPNALAPFQLEKARYKWRKSVLIPANWKTVIDAFIEGYHTPGTHPQTLRPQEGIDPSARPARVEEFARAAFTPTIPLRNHSRMVYSARPDVDHHEAERSAEMSRPDLYANLQRHLNFAIDSLATDRDARAAEQLATMDLGGAPPFMAYLELCEKLALEEGVDYPQMSIEEYFGGNGDWHVFPTMVILVEKGATLGYRMRPMGDDPDICLWEAFSIEHFAPGEVPATKWEHFPKWREADLGPFLAQDSKNLADIQAGMHSPAFEGAWLNAVQESSIRNLHRISDRIMFGVDDDVRDG